jgi:hypothetical protein
VIVVEPLPARPPLRRVLVAISPNAVRPDVAAKFPDVPDGDRGGFRTAVSLLGLPREFELRLESVFEGYGPVAFARVEGRRRALDTGYRARFRPIIVRTLGRAGSTWLTQLVGAHPEAVAYRPFDFEPRMLDYWMEILRTLSHPHSYA